MITSNLVLSQWDRIFKDAMTTAATINRLVHHSINLDLTNGSIREDEAKERAKLQKSEEEPAHVPTVTNRYEISPPGGRGWRPYGRRPEGRRPRATPGGSRGDPDDPPRGTPAWRPPTRQGCRPGPAETGDFVPWPRHATRWHSAASITKCAQKPAEIHRRSGSF